MSNTATPVAMRLGMNARVLIRSQFNAQSTASAGIAGNR